MGRKSRYNLPESIIINDYLLGKSAYRIATEYKATCSAVYHILQKNDIKRRSNKLNSRKYIVNHSFFSIIDSQEKAYWLGFLYADGYLLSRDQNQIGISLSIGDEKHLDKLREALSSNYPIKEYISNTKYKKNTKYCRLLITSQKIYQDLIDKGMYPNKSLILTFPSEEIIPKKLLHHFIRGYFDGDGTLSYDKNDNTYRFKMCGTREFLLGVLNWINSKHDMEVNKLFKRRMDQKNSFYISIGGDLQIKRILDSLYQNATIFLERKKIRYSRLISKYGSYN